MGYDRNIYFPLVGLLCLIHQSEAGDGTRSGQNWSNLKEGLRKESLTIKRLGLAAKLKSIVVWKKLVVGSQEWECHKLKDMLATLIITPITSVHVNTCNAGYLVGKTYILSCWF